MCPSLKHGCGQTRASMSSSAWSWLAARCGAFVDVLQFVGHRQFGCAPEWQPCTCACCASSYRQFKLAVKALKKELLTFYYAGLDDETEWLPKLLITLAVAYALSPIDLIPDFIPVLGLVDDLILLPLLLYLAKLATPKHVLERAAARAESEPLQLPKSVPAAVFVGVTWSAAPQASSPSRHPGLRVPSLMVQARHPRGLGALDRSSVWHVARQRDDDVRRTRRARPLHWACPVKETGCFLTPATCLWQPSRSPLPTFVL